MASGAGIGSTDDALPFGANDREGKRPGGYVARQGPETDVGRPP